VNSGVQSKLLYTGHFTVDEDSLLVRLTCSLDHELDSSLALTYSCHDDGVMASNVTSCRAVVVISDVNDQSPHIKFSNLTTTKYDRLAPIEVTAQVCAYRVHGRPLPSPKTVNHYGFTNKSYESY